MITPRQQTILFSVLLAASLIMAIVLWQLREHAHQRLLQGEDSAPTQAPQVAAAEQATLIIASDADNSMVSQVETLPLPQDPGARARLILGKLLDLYAAPDAAHAVPGGAASILQVFLLPAPALPSGTAAPNLHAELQGLPCRPPGQPYQPMDEKIPCPTDAKSGPKADTNGAQLAVVNLTGAFVATHPSGIEAETLTIQSICATLHANLPKVTQVRFLVDGQVHPTLAGHADLTRTYLASEAVPSTGQNP